MLRSTKWFARELERREREWAAERRTLVETICHLAGAPIAPTELDEAAERQILAERRAAEKLAADEADLVEYDQLPEHELQ